MRRTLAAVAVTAVAGGAALAGTASAREGSRFREPAEGRLGVVATESAPAARVGRAVLTRGGNAVDAAVSTVFAIGASRPQSCGIGGGGFLVLRSRSGRTAALDFRETAPAAIRSTSFQGPGIFTTFTGHKTVGVPGTVAGMATALRRYGTISFSEALRPAESLARNGIRVPASMSEAMSRNAARLRMFPAAAEQYLVEGTAPYPPGSTLRQPDMARTIALMRRVGPRAFYEGRIARLIARDMRNAGDYPGDEGLMTKRDLARYRAKWRTPLSGTYRGRRITAMPAPTSGGIAILEMLNILEGFGLRRMGQSSADALHVLAEAEKIAFADRNEYVADPDFVDVPQRTLTSKRYAAARREEIDMRTAKRYSPGRIRAGSSRVSATTDSGGTTTHISVIDARGNAVAVTCTIEQEFGSAVVAPGTGFLLNNELTDFGAPGTANEPAPRKRPRSSMSPTIVSQRGEPVMVTGGAGGIRIIMGALLSIVNRIDFGRDVAHAVDDERIDAFRGNAGGAMFIEDARIRDDVEADLQSRGHTLEREGEYGPRPRVNAAGVVSLRSLLRQAYSDSRTDPASVAQRRRARR